MDRSSWLLTSRNEELGSGGRKDNRGDCINRGDVERLASALRNRVALFVAAVGITNTMILSVLARTDEIGVMKALGAKDRHIQLIFLVEGVVIGLGGSSLGLALGRLASFPGDAIAKSTMEPQTQTPVKGTLFVFPTWMVVGVPLLVCLITTLAALYPASALPASIRSRRYGTNDGFRGHHTGLIEAPSRFPWSSAAAHVRGPTGQHAGAGRSPAPTCRQLTCLPRPGDSRRGRKSPACPRA